MKINFQKHIGLMISSVIVLGLMAFAGWMLQVSASHYGEQYDGLQAILGRLNDLYGRDPFPSRENLKIEEDNLALLAEAYSELNQTLRAGQIEAQKMEAADFMTVLGKTRRGLQERLDLARVMVPDKFAFGFDIYDKGTLPRNQDIPKLVQQLKVVDALCEIVADTGIGELLSMTREDIETSSTAATAAAGRRDRGGAAPQAAPAKPAAQEAMCSRMHFKMQFRAKENVVFDVMNRLAVHPMFVVITYVEMSNQRQSMKDFVQPATGAPETKKTAVPGEPLPLEQRMILGKEDVEVKLELDVYWFTIPPELNTKT